MAEEIIARYKLEVQGQQELLGAVHTATQATQQLGKEVKSAYATKTIEDATDKVEEHAKAVTQVAKQYTSAKAELKDLTNQIASGQLAGKPLQEATKRAAELKDRIGDVNNEIKKLSSDTRVFDTLVQGMRGVAAAGSIVTGTMAAFGNENKDVQQTLLKVQGAMATLQGVQELANIATEQGGIKTVIYGGALKAVEVIQKTFAVSSAAAWGIATAGLTVLVAGVAALIYYYDDLIDAASEYLGIQRQISGETIKGEQERIEAIEKGYEKEIGIRKAKGEDTKKLELRRVNDVIAILEEEYKQYGTNADFVKFYFDKKYNLLVKQAQLETDIAKQAEQDRIKAFEKEKTDYANHIKDVEKLSDEFVKKSENLNKELIAQGDNTALNADQRLTYYLLGGLNKEEAVQRFTSILSEVDKRAKAVFDSRVADNGVFQQTKEEDKKRAQQANDLMLGLTKDFGIKRAEIEKEFGESSETDFAKFEAGKRKELQKTLDLQKEFYNQIVQLQGNAAGLASAIFANQSQELDQQRQKDLTAAGDDAKKKLEIEKKYAIEKAKIARTEAIINKAFAILNIAINTADAISKAGGNAGLIALAAANGAIQTATVIAQPLPPIPQFEHGGPVKNKLLHGRSHREGGILINAQGGEYIWDIPTVKKHGDIIRAAHENRIEDLILHKYVAPLLEGTGVTTATKAATFDDFMLRATINKATDKADRNAKYIADRVSSAVTSSLFNQKRYN